MSGRRLQAIERAGDRVHLTLTDGSRYTAAMAFLAIGRKPDTAALNLAAAGLAQTDGGGLPVDAYGRTPAPTVFAAGDVTGGPMVANRAMAQAWIAGRIAAGSRAEPYNPHSLIRAVYTDPQVAQVGSTVDSAPGLMTVHLSLSAGLKPKLLQEVMGFVEVVYDPTSRLVVGGLAVGAHAADALAPIATAVHLSATVDQLTNLYLAHPSFTELGLMTVRLVPPPA